MAHKNQLSRRDFLTVTGQMGVAAWLGTKLYDQRAWSSPEQVRAALQPLLDIAAVQGPVYEGEHLEHIGFPLGGIGTGSVALVGTGEVSEWQIWNRVYKPARIGQTFFAVSGKSEDGESFKRVLQTSAFTEAADLSPMKSLSFRGEFPIAYVDYHDDLPVEISLEAWSPMVPLEPGMSAYPMALLNWKIRNKTNALVQGHLLGSLQNAVGHDGFSVVKGNRFMGYGRNRVHSGRTKNTHHLYFDAVPGKAATFEKPIVYATNDKRIQLALETVQKSRVHFDGAWTNNWIALSESVLKDGVNVVWMGKVDPTNCGEPSAITTLTKAVNAGTNLVIMGGKGSAVEAILKPRVAENETVMIADFEGGQYPPGWKVEGEAFGGGPAKGTFSKQNPVTGFIGLGLVNSYQDNDDLLGKLVSPELDLCKSYLQFLVGGGNNADTEIRLVVDGAVVRSAAGVNSEQLRRKIWDISEFKGKKGHLEIVDEGKGGWGHINVDDIRLSDHETMAFTPEEAELIGELLPFKTTEINMEGGPKASWTGQHHLQRSTRLPLTDGLPLGILKNLELKEGAEVIPGPTLESPLAVVSSLGKGKVVFLNFDQNEVHPGDLDTLLGGVASYLTGVKFTPRTGTPKESPFFGNMALGCLSGEAEALPVWTDPKDVLTFLEGGVPKRVFQSVQSQLGESFAGALRIPYSLKPGEESQATFAISWYFPNHFIGGVADPDHRVGNKYNTLFLNARDVFETFARNREEVEGLTYLFHDTFYRSTLPVPLIDCVTSQASILKSQTSMWLEDGTFAGWEGVSVSEGCCPMNCTHVYNYAQTMACLYPNLEREVRTKDLGIQLTQEGLIHHRLAFPLSAPRNSGEALDGQLGTLLKLYREYRRSADDAFLGKWWVNARKAMTFVWKNHDPNGEGIILDCQFNTYDDAVYGINSFIGSLYLAALRAMEEMSLRMGDEGYAKQCRERFEKGKNRLSEECWNGEYYFQPGDLTQLKGRNYGTGCFADQVVGQWWAHILNLGYVLPEDRVKAALEAVLKYNWRERMEGHKQVPRVYAAPDDSGLLIGTWPNGGRPEVPTLYVDEVWTGIEYQVAGHLMFEGLTDKSIDIVTKVRKRSDGRLRKGTHPSGVGNPWDEIECGDHYARAMSSYSLLLSAQGQIYDGPRQSLGFHPLLGTTAHASFFTTAQGWGSFEQKIEGNSQSESLFLCYGQLPLRQLSFSLPKEAKQVTDVVLNLGEDAVAVTWKSDMGRIVIGLTQPVTLSAGNRLLVKMAYSV